MVMNATCKQSHAYDFCAILVSPGTYTPRNCCNARTSTSARPCSAAGSADKCLAGPFLQRHRAVSQSHIECAREQPHGQTRCSGDEMLFAPCRFCEILFVELHGRSRFCVVVTAKVHHPTEERWERRTIHDQSRRHSMSIERSHNCTKSAIL